MQVEKVTIEKVTLDENDIIQAVLLLMREKGYNFVKSENISINPTNITAVCTIQNIEEDSKKN
jgi:hypothetical protein